jgi:acyl transferase domain-containing protein
MEAGLDSFGAVELASKISMYFDIKVPSTFLFSYPTVREILGYLKEQLLHDEGEDKATGAIGQQYQRNTASEDSAIAIVGIACELPGDVWSLDGLQQVQHGHIRTTGPVSSSRWDIDALLAKSGASDREVVGKARYGSFLSDAALESLRNDIFGISDMEAKAMSPSQCLALEMSYDALVDAGYDKEGLRRSDVGVFLGMGGAGSGSAGSGEIDKYDSLASSADQHLSSAYSATGGVLSVTAGRISYCLGLEGPAMTIDTACSSSLVALHQAKSCL